MADFSLNQEPLLNDDNISEGSGGDPFAGKKMIGDAEGNSTDNEDFGEVKIGQKLQKDSYVRQTTKAIKRTFPIFAEIIIIGFYLFVFGIFLYYAYIYKNPNTNPCKANAQSTYPLIDSNSVGVNVTEKFQKAIRFGFWLATINLLRSVMGQLAFYFNNVTMQYMSYLIFAINSVLVITLFVFMQIWRWDNAGKVCSGVTLTTTVTGPYLITEGQFLKWVIIVSYLLLSFGLIGFCCIGLFFAEKHEAIGMFQEGGLFVERVKPSWQVNVEVNDGLRVDKTTMKELKLSSKLD